MVVIQVLTHRSTNSSNGGLKAYPSLRILTVSNIPVYRSWGRRRDESVKMEKVTALEDLVDHVKDDLKCDLYPSSQ